MNVLTLKLNAVQVVALACFGLVAGVWIKKRLPVLDRLNIPSSIVGGLMYAVLALILRDRWLNLEMDMVLRDILMVAFFTTIGMSASLRLVKEGGVQVVWFFAIATVGAVLQNVLGVGLARVFGLDPLLGIVAGSVALTGGPATALAFGKTFEQLGVEGATTLGIASATFGITAGGLVGGHIGGSLIRRFRLTPASSMPRPADPAAEAEAIAYEGGSPVAIATAPAMTDESVSEQSALMNSVIAIAIAMGLGSIVSMGFERAGVILPAYVGAMMAAAVIRNLDDRRAAPVISEQHVETIGNIALYVFIVMALLTLRLWELVHLALPMVVMLVAQVALVWLMCVTLCYRLMGRDYDSAVMAGGFTGFMLGTTANAMACMGVLTEKYGPAPRAFIVVPIVGAFLIDFTNALIITAMTYLFR